MITKSLTQTPSGEIMMIIKVLREVVDTLKELPTRGYFGEIIKASEKKIAFLGGFLQDRLKAGKRRTVSAYKEIQCLGCTQNFEVQLKAVLSGSGYVKYYRDDSPHECPACGWREVEGQGMIIIRFNE